MLATDHKTYQDYVAYNHSQGYQAFSEKLWNALKEKETVQ